MDTNATNICQSCAMPLDSDDVHGTNADGTLNDEYCVYCYKDGQFTQPDMTLEDAISVMAQFADEAGMTTDEATAYGRQVLPTLKRWRV